MEKVIEFSPSNVCSRKMKLVVDSNGIITRAEIIGGCQGNTGGIMRLIVGMKAEDVVKRLEGISCRGSRTGNTSCPDQLAQGLKKYL